MACSRTCSTSRSSTPTCTAPVTRGAVHAAPLRRAGRRAGAPGRREHGAGGRLPHSIHGYFLRGGRPDRPTIMAVDRDRDGGSFSARHVNALQEGEVIFSALASFHVDEDGVDYQLPDLPADVGEPDSMPEHDRPGHNPVFDLRYFSPVEAEPGKRAGCGRGRKPCSPTTASPGRACSPTSRTWGGRSAGARRHRYRRTEPRSRGLVPPVGDGEPVAAARPVPGVGRGPRGMYVGTIHDRTGTLAASLAQEKLLRPPRPPR